MGALILCVDDEPLVRDITRIALERGGYRVLLAADGQEAIALLENSPEPVALVLLDWNVPGMDSNHLIVQLRTLRPGLRILLTSGYDREEVMSKADSRQVDGFLPKPYRPVQLLQRVDRVLKQEQPTLAAASRRSAP